MEVAVLVGELVQIKQGLVDRFLQLKDRLHRIQPATPVVLGRLFNVLKRDATSAVVLESHKQLRMFHLLTRSLAKITRKAR